MNKNILNLPDNVTIRDVGPRDGFQAEKEFILTDKKVTIINALSRTGLKMIEATSFVHPKIVPQMRDALEVMQRIERVPGVIYSAFVPNVFGARRAVEAGIDCILVTVVATETYNHKNMGMSIGESMARLVQAIEVAKEAGISAWGAIGAAFGCPYEGEVPEDRVLALIGQFLDAGAEGIFLGDPTGMANPCQVVRLVHEIFQRWPGLKLDLHFHDARGMAMANILAAMQAGVTIFDGSIGGLGGSPFGPDPTGNIPTEDLVHMLSEMGIETGIDLDALIACAHLTQEVIGRELPGRLMRMGKRSDLHTPWR